MPSSAPSAAPPHAVGLIENLRFHLVTKPQWRGTQSLAEGWLDEVLADLRKVASTLGS
jgi:hypothetical protein